MKRSDPDMSEEYDLKGGERGRHAAAYARETNLVLIDPDLFVEFPSRKPVNDALREVLRQRRRRLAVAK
jgi:hypothetical protein